MNITRVACVGAGLIGQGWATLFSSQGCEVILQDVTEVILKKAVKHVTSNLSFLEEHNLLRYGKMKDALKRIKTTTSIAEAVGRADYVQESVPDNYDVKKQIFKEMDAVAPNHTILASSTSGLLMTNIQKVTTRPERCVLVHPVLPVHLIPLVEIVGGEQTSQETVNTAYEFMLTLGKAPVVLTREVPGYIINRLQAAILREAIDLVDKGIASVEAVDKAFCMGIGLRDPLIGPFLRIHLAGNGVERFLENYSQSYSYRWETMETWTAIPPSAAKKTIQGVYEMDVVHTKSLDEIIRWRDEMLVKLLKIIQENQ
ncbi:MAG: 3-hydroxyacyl-CoA dehydrogenase NAD-binding domain-containing protein [Candidatus Heimdallarchaeota archaeon]